MKNYLNPIIHWWWLILLCTILAAAGSYYIYLRQPLIYEAKATLIVGRSISNPNPSAGEIYLEQQLASIYADLGRREQITSAVMQKLGLSTLPTIVIRSLPNTPLIEILVSDTNPARAQAIANEIANQMILTGPVSRSEEALKQQAFIRQQIEKTKNEIEKTEEDIWLLMQNLSELTSARQIQETQAQINAQQQKLVALQANYVNLLARSEQSGINILSIIQTASLPTTPTGPGRTMVVGLAALIGALISISSAYFIDNLDDTLKGREEIAEAIGVPVIGYIPNISFRQDRWNHLAFHPNSPVADAFRTLRTNLDFISFDRPMKSILITGVGLSHGKSLIAANLAYAMAASEKKVVLVNGDLRQSRLDEVFKLEDKSGITDVCTGRITLADALIPWENGNISKQYPNQPDFAVYQTLKILPGGSSPPNPAELIASQKFTHILEQLVQTSDCVIIDSPPIFIPEATILSRKVDGVLIVIQPGKISKKTAQLMADTIKQTGMHVLGIVLNRYGEKHSYYHNRYYARKKPGIFRN